MNQLLESIFLLFGASIVIIYEFLKVFFTNKFKNIILRFKSKNKQLSKTLFFFLIYYGTFIILGLLIKFNWIVIIYFTLCIINDLHNTNKSSLFKIDGILTILLMIYWIII